MQIADERVGGQAASPAPAAARRGGLDGRGLGGLPAELVAVTWKPYAVDAASPDTVAEVPVTERTLVPPR